MSEISLLIEDNKAHLVGELTRQNIALLSQKKIHQMIKQDELTVNLAKISKVDTAGLAWLIYLLEQANAKSCQLIFSNLPEKLTKLIELSGAQGFLPVKS